MVPAGPLYPAENVLLAEGKIMIFVSVSWGRHSCDWRDDWGGCDDWRRWHDCDDEERHRRHDKD